MDFCEAIRRHHNLTSAGLEAFCHHVRLPVSADTVGALSLRKIVKTEQDNDLAQLDHLRRRMGVYAFQLCGCVVYVGKCEGATEKWNLRQRVSQHLREGDDGGNFRKNWYRQHGEDFPQYEATLARCTLWTMSFPHGGDIQKIRRLEHLLIGLLGPRYCDVPAP